MMKMMKMMMNKSLIKCTSYIFQWITYLGITLLLACESSSDTSNQEEYERLDQRNIPTTTIDQFNPMNRSDLIAESILLGDYKITHDTEDLGFKIDQNLFSTADGSIVIQTDAFQLELPETPEGFPIFCFPILHTDRSLILEAPIIGVDHDPQAAQATQCLSHHGLAFPHCYDGHDGTDFLLAGGFETMDAGSAIIVAAADGEVIQVVDGHYDRCHAELSSLDVSCDGNPIRANFVKIEHENGWQSWYYHFRKNSILVQQGQFLTAGTPLGLVGSSGRSALPHLHFEVQDARGNRWDPFAGPYSQEFSLWLAEGRFLPVRDCISP